MEITKEWIDQQRAAALEALNMQPCAHRVGLRLRLFGAVLPAALDALEASMQREAEKAAEIERLKGENAQIRKDVSALIGEEMAFQEGHIPSDADRVAEIKRLTAERDAAVTDLRTLAINNQDCATCMHGKNNRDDCAEYEGPCEYEWRGLCDANAHTAAEGDKFQGKPFADRYAEGLAALRNAPSGAGSEE